MYIEIPNSYYKYLSDVYLSIIVITGVDACPTSTDAFPDHVWKPSYNAIKKVEYKMQRQAYSEFDDREMVCNLLREWSGLDSGLKHDVNSIAEHHVLYWQDCQCFCPEDQKTGKFMKID